jgi:hypothetical protein
MMIRRLTAGLERALFQGEPEGRTWVETLAGGSWGHADPARFN